MIGFLLGASVLLNVIFIMGFKATIENMKKEIEDFKKNNSNNIVESFSSKVVADVIKACGGVNNISECKTCVTRLKVDVIDISKIDTSCNVLSKYKYFISNNTLQMIMGNSNVKSDVEYLINTIK